jgi:hypothetical protein
MTLARVEDCTTQCDKGLTIRPTVAGLSSFSYLYNTLQVEAGEQGTEFARSVSECLFQQHMQFQQRWGGKMFRRHGLFSSRTPFVVDLSFIIEMTPYIYENDKNDM